MWCRIFVSFSVLHSCQPEVKVWTSAQNTRKPSSPRNISCLLGDPSYIVISLQVSLERLENLLFIINTLYRGLGRDKIEYPVIVKATVRINRDWAPYEWLPWRRNCRLGGMNSTITEVFFSPAQNKNAFTRQKSQLSTQRSSEWTGAFIRGGVWSWIPAAATFTVSVGSHGFQHLWREP